MRKKSYLIVLFIASLGMISCSKDDSTSENGPDGTDTTTTNTGGIEGSIAKLNGNITISGSKNYEFANPFENAKYIETYKEKTAGSISQYSEYNSFTGWTGRKPGSSSALNSVTGYYETADIVGMDDLAERKFKIEARGEYKIEYVKLPQVGITPAALPQTYSGAGRRVFGPFTVTASTTFTITCADAQQAGFTAQLYDASGSEILDADYKGLYINWKSGASVNNISETITRTDLTAGEYYLNIDANGDANYTVKVN